MLVCLLLRAFCGVCLEFVFFPALYHVPPCPRHWRFSRGKKMSNTRNLMFWYDIKGQSVINKVLQSHKALWSALEYLSLCLSLCTDCLCPVWVEGKTLPHHSSQCCCVCFGGGKKHTWTHGNSRCFSSCSVFVFHAVCSSLSHLAGQQDQPCVVGRNYVVKWICCQIQTN